MTLANIIKLVPGRIAKEINFLKECCKMHKSIIRRRVPIMIEYPMDPLPRQGWGKPTHDRIRELLDRSREKYIETMKSYMSLRDVISNIPFEQSDDPAEPCWHNNWLGGFGALSLYGMLADLDPEQYVEIGSGFSTRFARKAVTDKHLKTKITSIDPCPRAEIDELCDVVIRKGLQDADLTIFEELKSGDIVFFDGSHYCFMNSDVTVFFLEILPKLRPGVLVYIDDIFLPDDYPPQWSRRYYSEQYMLATTLLADQGRYEIMLPCWHIHKEDQLRNVRDKIWQGLGVQLGPGNGIWIKISTI